MGKRYNQNSTGQYGSSTYTVSNVLGQARFNSLEEAIDQTPEGETLYMFPGVYTLSAPLTIPRSMSIIGSAPGDLRDQVTITGGTISFSETGILSFSSVTFLGGSNTCLEVLGTNDSVVTFNNCDVLSNATGLFFNSSGNSSFYAQDSKFEGEALAVDCLACQEGHFLDCIVKNTNPTSPGSALSISGSSITAETTSFLTTASGSSGVELKGTSSFFSTKCSYNCNGAAFNFSGATTSATASSVFDLFFSQGTYYAVATGGAAGTLSTGYACFEGGAKDIDPAITQKTFVQRTSPSVISYWRVVGTPTAGGFSGVGLIVNAGAGTTISLPSNPSVGDSIAVLLGETGTSWKIAQTGTQHIVIGDTSTTPGASGYVSSLSTGDALTLICTQGGANSEWHAVAVQGNLKMV